MASLMTLIGDTTIEFVSPQPYPPRIQLIQADASGSG